MSFALKFFTDGTIIFDNAIMNHANFSTLIKMRVCIDFGRCAVRCPASVRNTDSVTFMFLGREVATQLIHQAGNFTDGLKSGQTLGIQ